MILLNQSRHKIGRSQHVDRLWSFKMVEIVLALSPSAALLTEMLFEEEGRLVDLQQHIPVVVDHLIGLHV